MSYSTKQILTDVNGKPMAQFYNPTADDYRPLTGVDLGGGRYGTDGLMWGKTSGGLYVPVAVNTDGAVNVEVTGGVTTPTHTKKTIAITTTEVLAANTNRKWALFVNDSDEVIYIKLGANAVLNEGIRINASGGSFEMSSNIGNLYTGAINGICTSGSKTLLVTEGV